MRPQIAAALLVVFALLAFLHSAAAQSTPPPQPKASPEKPPSAAKPLPFPETTQIVLLPSKIGSANDPTITPQELKTLISTLQQRKLASNMQRFGGGLDAPNCAHIRIIRAPEMDSVMVVEAPPGEGGPIQTFQGLPPCRRDLPAPMAVQHFHGVPPMPLVPPRTPFVQPTVSRIPSGQPRPVQPKPDTPGAKP